MNLVLGKRREKGTVVEEIVHPRHPNVRAAWEEITPDVAKQYLEHNDRNRDLDKTNASLIGSDMDSGAWNDQNPAAVVFDENGSLANGQHRLIGIVHTGRTVTMLVVRGVSRDVYLTMDSGKSRSFTNTLQHEGFTNYATLSTMVKGCYAYKRYGSLSKIDKRSSNSALMTFLKQDEAHLVSLTAWSRAMSDNKQGLSVDLSAKRVGLLRYALENHGATEDDIEAFFSALAGRTDAPQPVRMLRKRLQQIRNAGASKRSSISAEYVFAVCIKAWNAYIRGEEVNRLGWKPGGAKPEPFPAIVVSAE